MNIWKHRFARAGRVIAAALVAGGLGLAALAAHANDDPPGRVGRLAELRGQVWLLEEGQGEWQSATINRPVTTADRIATDRGARAEVQIGSTTVRLNEASDLEISRLDDDRVELTLHGGAASLRVREPEVAREVQLTTPEGRFMPRGPGLFRIDRSDRGSLAGVTRGELEFESNDSQLALRAGQRADLWFDPSDGRTHYNWSQPVYDDFEQWVRADESREQRYGTRPPISPEMTGAEDLNRNGQWSTHPEYGAIWYPTTVVAGWAPYRYGYWAWVRPWGWTWVDDAPWGFAPFHYGRWVFWGGRWCWAPGVYVRRPVYAPAMVAWVGGSHLSVSLSIGGGQPVGWVPLAPREAYYPAYRVSPVYIQQINITHVHLPPQPAPQPRRPIMYANSGVAGGVTVVSSDVLTRRQPIAAAPRANDADVVRVLRTDKGIMPVAPPTPVNASYGPRQALSPGRAVPPPPTANGGQRPYRTNPDDPRGGLAPAPRRPDAPVVNNRPGAPEGGGAVVQPGAPQGTVPESPRQRVPRPPLGAGAGRDSGRDAGPAFPPPRREQEGPGFTPSPRDGRELRDAGPRGAHPVPLGPGAQPMPAQPMPVQPPPRVVPRDDRQPERSVERQVERQERKHEARRENPRERRDGPLN
jgi:hypothetical protein